MTHPGPSRRAFLGGAVALGVSLTNVPILNHRRSPDLDRYTQELYELRRAKGATLDEAAKQVLDPLYFGNLMVRAGKADGDREKEKS